MGKIEFAPLPPCPSVTPMTVLKGTSLYICHGRRSGDSEETLSFFELRCYLLYV